MPTSPPAQLSERRLSSIDRFCIQTYQTAQTEAARHVRGIASTLGFLCVMLILCLGIAVWQANALEQERDVLVQELRSERAARLEAAQTANDVGMNEANYELDTRVRRDIVDERMLRQERRSLELEQLAEKVEREKLVEADCVTPRSIMAAAGL